VDRSRYFARVPDYLNVDLLRSRLVVIVGVGMVGSPIAEELARCTVGRLRFIDHDRLEEENRARHVLSAAYVGWNKAEAMADYLSREVEGLTTDAVSRKIDASVPDSQIDKWLVGAHLVIAATDDRTAQRRVMQSALALDIPALAPALYVPHGGEVIFQMNWELPCFGCWDYFRTNEEQLRGARALTFVAWPVIHATIDLSLGHLDPLSGHGEIMSEGAGRPPNQVFRLDRLGTIERARGTRRPTCPSCGGGPAPPRTDAETGAVRRPRGGVGARQRAQPEAQERAEFVTRAQTKRTSGLLLGISLLVASLAALALTLALMSGSGSNPSASQKLPPAEISTAYSIRVDYSQSLAHMISAAHLKQGEDDPRLPEKDFPVTSGPAEVSVVLVHLTAFRWNEVQAPGNPEAPGGSNAYDEAQYSLRQLGLRPATLPELLAFSQQYPAIQSNSVIVELGSLSPSSQGEYRFCAVFGGYLEWGYTGGGFNQDSEFLAVNLRLTQS
jgi:hypothetical protein